MKRVLAASLTILLLASTVQAAMAHEGTILGAAIGGAAGAALGHEMSGRNGAIVLGAAGGMAGAMIGRSMEPPHRERVVIYDDYVPRHIHVAHEPPVQRVYYVQPARYQTIHYYRGEPRWRRHHHRHHGDD